MKALLFANTGWYLYNFRLALALKLRDEGYDVVLVSPPDEYGERLRESGLRWLSISMRRRSLNPWQEVGLVLRLVQLYIREKPDIVHHFTLKCVVYGAVAARIAGVPAVINAIAGFGYISGSSSIKARLLRPILSIVLRCVFSLSPSLLILQNSSDVAAVVGRRIAKAARVRLIRGSGVNVSRFRPQTACAPADEGQTIVLMASRLLWSKGVSEYVQAAGWLKREGYNVLFRLAGWSDPGSPDAVPLEQLEQWKSEGIVEVLGHVTDMAAEIARADVFVLPSYYGEGVPRSLLEAGSCGKPLVATDLPGCRELVRNEETGLLVPQRDVAALRAAIVRLCSDRDLRLTLGMAARARVVAEFDERLVLKQTINVYEELTKERAFDISADESVL